MLPVVFVCITLLFLLFFYTGTGWDKRVFQISVLWILVLCLISFSGFLQNTNFVIQPFFVVLIGNIILAVLFLNILKHFSGSVYFLVGLHSLRIPVEIVLYFLFIEGLIPKEMTFYGWNYDIVFGLSALVLLSSVYFFKAKPSKGFLFIWNISGIIFLGHIVTIAILSAPLPIQQLAFEQPNTAVLHFPYILLPGFIVPVVFVTHFMALKQLIRKSKNQRFINEIIKQ